MSAEFLLTLGDASQIPDLFNGMHLKGHNEPRIAMVGRSNVGKSTLINALLERKLAQTSNEPGKTRAIHFYKWPKAKKIIADLPGYGYARAGGAERDRWARFIDAYLKADAALGVALVLVDSRHGPSDLDEDALGFLAKARIPVRIVFTKTDGLKTQSERARRRKEAFQRIEALGYDSKEAFWVSAKDRDLGLRELSTWLRGE